MSMKPSLPQGTRDFSPVEMERRNFIIDTLKGVFRKYGYQQIETPSMEKLETLTGKYGEEGDRLIYRILDSGEKLKRKAHPEAVLNVIRQKEGREPTDDERKQAFDEFAESLGNKISEKALRYDLTIPFARFVVQHQNDITFPFKRFQIQPVWRADRPQKGRYREFYQCDCDVIGTESLLNEVELVQIYDEGLSSLGLPAFDIQINNRKVLVGIAEFLGMQDQLTAMTIIIDKLDKIGPEKVEEELKVKGLGETGVENLRALLAVDASNEEKIETLRNMIGNSEKGAEGLDEVAYVVDNTTKLGLRNGTLVFNPLLARGLDYYTGTIYEVKETAVNIGSIGGGGRYDDLTGIFGLTGMSGVGISFGAERIYDILLELNAFPDLTSAGTQILFTHFEQEDQDYCLPIVMQLREKGINAEVYPDVAKMKKQMKYANGKGVPYVVVVGSDERESGELALKDMNTGEQTRLSVEDLINKFTNG